MSVNQLQTLTEDEAVAEDMLGWPSSGLSFLYC